MAPEQRGQLAKWAMHRPTRGFPSPGAEEVSEGREGLVERSREIRVADTRHDLGQHRHAEQPVVVERHRPPHRRAQARPRAIAPPPRGASPGTRAGADNETVDIRDTRAGGHQLLFELTQPTLLPAQDAERQEVRRARRPTTGPACPRRRRRSSRSSASSSSPSSSRLTVHMTPAVPEVGRLSKLDDVAAVVLDVGPHELAGA